MSREAFLKRVQQAAAAGRAYRVSIGEFPEQTGYVGSEQDVCSAMATQVDAVGGQATIVNDAGEAREALQQIIQRHKVTAALCWQHPVLDRLEVGQFLQAQDVTGYDHDALRSLPQSQQREIMLAAGLGISSATYAIAETGTLVMAAQPGRERSVSLLPPVHVAVIEQSQIVPDLIDVIAALSSGQPDNRLPSNVTLITGPSKTGDIELQLTTGVHGPGTWYVIIVRS